MQLPEDKGLIDTCLSEDIQGMTHRQNVVFRMFVMDMRQKLAKNAHKGGWESDHPLVLLGRLLEECGELAALVNDVSKWEWDKIAQEAADVANFAMMVQDAVKSRMHPDVAGAE